MIPMPLSLTYFWGAYTIKRAKVQACCAKAAEVRTMLQFLGMSESQARSAMQLARHDPGEEFNFEWKMERLIYTPDSRTFYIRDCMGRWYHTTKPELYASGKEIRAALQHHENSKYPLPAFCEASGMYYWPPDATDLYHEDEISGDLAMIGWPAECVPLLLELARGCARLGIKD